MNSPQPKKSQVIHQNDSLVEQLRDLSRGVGKTISQDLVGGVAQDALSSLFGTPKPDARRGGAMQPGQPIDLSTQPPKEDTLDAFGPTNPRERFPFPFRRPREQFKPQFSQETLNRLRQQEAQVQQKIEEIRVELKQLIAEIRSVDKEIQKTVSQQLVNPGEYHMNFFDRLKAVLKIMLIEIKSSRNWLSTQKSKKKQGGYWAQYKKKGTTFGLSHERSVATQVG